jgi:hypothetical protein
MSRHALRHHPAPKRHLSEGLMYLALEKAFAASPAFDIIHVHAGFTAFPLMRRSPVPVLATVYGFLDTPEVARVYREFNELPLVATAIEQIQQCPDLNWQAIIPWPASSHQRIGFAARTEALDQRASAYGAVYEQLMPAETPLPRSSWPDRSRLGLVSPEHTVL